MQLVKTLLVALLGMSSYTLAAPVEGTTSVDASTMTKAKPADLCDQIYERARRERCERDREDRRDDEERQCRQFRPGEVRPRFCDDRGYGNGYGYPITY